MRKLNILIIGGTGFIGRTLSNMLLEEGHNISVLSRKVAPSSFFRDRITAIQADILKPGSWQKEIPYFDVVMNLSGDSIFRRWNVKGKQRIINSRIITTRNIVAALKTYRGNVRQFFSVSGVGYYGFHGDEILNENNSAGLDFIAQVAVVWEEAIQPVTELGIKLVLCRLGHVLGMHGGALPKLVALARLHLSSYWGNGNQWISWIHEQDLARAVLFLLGNDTIGGPINVTSPHPVRNREMMQMLAKTIDKRVLIPPIPRYMLHLMLGQFHTVFVNGQRVAPSIIQQNGFHFKFPAIDEALMDLLKP
ncbi:TIGR01777 family oxidoreductase [Chloroflexota bacterium]